MRWLLTLPLLLVLGCAPTLGVTIAESEAAQTLTMSRNRGEAHILLGSATDWDLITVPDWARQCLFLNEHASGDLMIGNRGETGTFVALTDEYITIPAKAGVKLPISGGGSEPTAAERIVPLFSATASLPVGISCTASSL